jgi:hypothetical protein
MIALRQAVHATARKCSDRESIAPRLRCDCQSNKSSQGVVNRTQDHALAEASGGASGNTRSSDALDAKQA